MFIVEGDWDELLNIAFFEQNKSVYEIIRDAVTNLSLKDPELTEQIVSLIRDLVQTDRTVSSITVAPATESPEDTLISIIDSLLKRSDVN